MNFAFSPEQDAFRAEARRFLAENVDLRVQIAMPDAHDPKLWQAMAAQGWLGAAIPAAYGGLELDVVDQCILGEETGRVLLPGPFGGTALIAATILAHHGTPEQCKTILPSLASGETIVAVAWEDDARDADLADWLILAHEGTQGEPASLAPRARYTTQAIDTADLTRARSHVSLNAGETTHLLATPLDQDTEARLLVLTSAEMVGTAGAALDKATAYAKQREQFGRAIGSFQAIKHKTADMLRALTAARLGVYAAAAAIDAGAPDVHLHARIAKALSNDALILCATENIQIHGGIGFTWEHDAHRYYRRALEQSIAFGDTPAHRDAVAATLLEEIAQ